MNLSKLFSQEIANWGFVTYLFIFLVALLESLAFVGLAIPGTVLVTVAGILAAQGLLAIGELICWVTLGAIVGGTLSYYLGRQGTRFFQPGNRFLKTSYLEKGRIFFAAHGNKSIFLAKFIGPLRPVIPFVAGLAHMNKKSFFLWNVVSAFIWAASLLLLGYFFGDALSGLEIWSGRLKLFSFSLLVAGGIIWFIGKKCPVFNSLKLKFAAYYSRAWKK